MDRTCEACGCQTMAIGLVAFWEGEERREKFLCDYCYHKMKDLGSVIGTTNQEGEEK